MADYVFLVSLGVVLLLLLLDNREWMIIITYVFQCHIILNLNKIIIIIMNVVFFSFLTHIHVFCVCMCILLSHGRFTLMQRNARINVCVCNVCLLPRFDLFPALSGVHTTRIIIIDVNENACFLVYIYLKRKERGN